MNNFFILVDDNFDDADFFRLALMQVDRSAGFSHIADGRKLFDYLNIHPVKPDLIFLDINLPGLNGWECLSQLKNNPAQKDLPVIMYSSMYDLDHHEMARRMKAIGLLAKPNSIKTLVEMLTVITQATKEDLGEVIKSFLR